MSYLAFDPGYFSNDSWDKRVQNWLRGAANNPFLEGNHRIIRQIVSHDESGLRMVINIGAEALLSFLAERHYYNLYEEPVIGGKRRTPSQERIQVDRLLGFGNRPREYYFGAVALGGTGVRFYGEYCMAIKPSEVPDDTQIFDRDSYDLLLPPLSDVPNVSALATQLRGSWKADVIDMLVRKVLPELQGANQLITTGTVSEMILHDQEFVEIHKRGVIGPRSIEEVRQSPDEIAIEARIQGRANAGLAPNAVELRWLQQRRNVLDALAREGIPCRVVTLHGRGYQWR
ncbi:MAG TPA: hypothetical protein VLW65_25120 [Bryobacteraceae bacterium]|nr:hypothetical protein [Bryobacteraceae bacterium]